MNDQLKIAKLNDKIESRKADIEAIKLLINNPMLEIVLGFTIIEILQKTDSPWSSKDLFGNRAPLVGELAGTAAEAGIFTAVALQQLAALAPAIGQSGGLASLLPMLIK